MLYVFCIFHLFYVQSGRLRSWMLQCFMWMFSCRYVLGFRGGRRHEIHCIILRNYEKNTKPYRILVQDLCIFAFPYILCPQSASLRSWMLKCLMCVFSCRYGLGFRGGRRHTLQRIERQQQKLLAPKTSALWGFRKRFQLTNRERVPGPSKPGWAASGIDMR
jgi:hypothetical protein